MAAIGSQNASRPDFFDYCGNQMGDAFSLRNLNDFSDAWCGAIDSFATLPGPCRSFQSTVYSVNALIKGSMFIADPAAYFVRDERGRFKFLKESGSQITRFISNLFFQCTNGCDAIRLLAKFELVNEGQAKVYKYRFLLIAIFAAIVDTALIAVKNIRQLDTGDESLITALFRGTISSTDILNARQQRNIIKSTLKFAAVSVIVTCGFTALFHIANVSQRTFAIYASGSDLNEKRAKDIQVIQNDLKSTQNISTIALGDLQHYSPVVKQS